MIKVGVIGGAGYIGGETLRILLNHPEVIITFVQSDSQYGKKLYSVHHDMFGDTEMVFEKDITNDVDLIFICKGHGEAKQFLENTEIAPHIKVIDLSQDFRHHSNCLFGDRNFVYGLPELNKEKIKLANSIANPGCFASAIQLALLPLAEKGLLNSDIHVTATTGSTGAGQSLSASNHFSWRSNNLSGYKLLAHQHEKEILESISFLQTGFNSSLQFIPQRGAFTRGIYSVCYLKVIDDLDTLKDIYTSYYSGHPFTNLVPFEIDVKQVVNTNNCFISLQKEKDTLVIISAIDNMLKGAAGQAVQNMNLLFGLNETTGLKLKPTAF